MLAYFKMNVSISNIENTNSEEMDWFTLVFCTFMIGMCLLGCFCIPKCGDHPTDSIKV
jgi:hypothetical protein